MSELAAPTEHPPARCYACASALEPESVHTTHEQALAAEQWDNALVIGLEGGYGMFVDPIGEPVHAPERGQLGSLKVVICHDCAHSLCAHVPWMARLINPLNSHAHRHGRDWAGHEGWDLPHVCPACGAGTVFDQGEQRKVCPQRCASR